MKQFNYSDVLKGRSIYTFNILMAHALVCAMLFSCGQQDYSEQDFQPYEGPVSIVENFELTFSDSAKVQVKLMAKKQLELSNGDRNFPEGVYIEFYNKEEVLETTLQANTGKYIKEENIYTGIGDVKINNRIQEKSLYTEELHWNPGTEKIFTDKNVIIIQDGERITGTGLVASQDFETYEIENPRGSFAIEETEGESK